MSNVAHEEQHKPSVMIEGSPRIFREDLTNQLQLDVFDELIRKTAEQRQLNIKTLEVNILLKGLSDTLVNLVRTPQASDKEEDQSTDS